MNYSNNYTYSIIILEFITRKLTITMYNYYKFYTNMNTFYKLIVCYTIFASIMYTFCCYLFQNNAAKTTWRLVASVFCNTTNMDTGIFQKELFRICLNHKNWIKCNILEDYSVKEKELLEFQDFQK